MTNRELLHAPEESLSERDRQRLLMLRVLGRPMPCPACKVPVNTFAATGIDIDAFDGRSPRAYRCPACAARLEQIRPTFTVGPPWFWVLEEAWLQEQLRKARAFDQEHPAAEGPTPP
jgi:hypothetical protein